MNIRRESKKQLELRNLELNNTKNYSRKLITIII